VYNWLNILRQLNRTEAHLWIVMVVRGMVDEWWMEKDVVVIG